MATKQNTPCLYMLACAQTDVGKKRERNEDNYLCLPDVQDIVAVADGMGGHAAGDVASRTAIATLYDYFRSGGQGLQMAVQSAHEAVLDKARADRAYHNMGSTLVALGLTQSRRSVEISHLGDSRCYRIRYGKIKLLTEDHTVIATMQKTSGLSATELQLRGISPHMLTAACGIRSSIAPSLYRLKACKDDIYILCSDGLYGELEDGVILNLVMKNLPDGVSAITKALVQTALDLGGHDNVTVVTCKLVPE